MEELVVDVQLRATLERELAPAYMADDDPLGARYHSLAASRGSQGGTGGLLTAAGSGARLRLAALVVAGAVVVGGAAVLDASRSNPWVIAPLLQPASGRQPAGGPPPAVAPPKPAVRAQGAKPAAPGGGGAGSMPAGAATGHDHAEAAPKLTEPSPSPERESGAPAEPGNKIEPTPKPSCSTPPPTSDRASVEAPATPAVTGGRPPGAAARDAAVPAAATVAAEICLSRTSLVEGR